MNTGRSVNRDAGQESMPPDLPGYRFISHIGAGGNARVYLYEQNLPRRRVAVKVLNEPALSEAARRRFTDEADLTAGLAHRHIVQVFEANVTADDRPYLVMPYYPQPNLSVRARRSHFSVAAVLRIGIQIGGAVETSHRGGVLHRDIKPQNILTDSYGEPVLTDFGIATTTGGDGPEGLAAGLSVPWSPPEILYGTSPGDQRSDVYSLGATLWHLLVGRSPFEASGGDNGTLALMGRIKADPVARTGRADVPDSLERVLRRAMAKDPAARPQSAMELIRALQSVEQELRLTPTQPILPADEPQGDTPVGDTIIRPQAYSAAAASRDAPGLDTSADQAPDTGAGPRAGTDTDDGARSATGGATATVGGVTAAKTGTAAAAADAGTAAKTGTTAEPGTAAETDGAPADGDQQQDDEAQTRLRAPVRLDPWGTRTDEPVESVTVLRPSVARDARPAAAESAASQPPAAAEERAGVNETGGRHTGRVLAFGGAGVVVVAAAVVALLALHHSGGTGAAGAATGTTTAGQATQSANGQSALGGDAASPGQPAVTVRRVSATQVEFTWTYANAAAGDTFRWQQLSGAVGEPAGVVTQPDLPLTVAKGVSACVTVTVRSADGQASLPSSPVCSPT